MGADIHGSAALAHLQVLIMKSWIKPVPTTICNRFAAMLTALFCGAGLQAQTQYDFTIEPSINAYCEDTVPLGDGFGWNGTCGCDVVPVWEEFGRRVAASNGILAIAAKNTPENCPGITATVSIYEKNSSGQWIKATEVPGTSASMVDDMVLVNSNAYRKINNEWQELRLIDNDEYQFKAIDGLPGTVVSTNSATRALRFSTRDINGVEVTHNEIQALRGERFTHIVISGDIAGAKNTNWINEVGRPPIGVVLFHRDSNGIWQRGETIGADVDDPVNHLFTVNNSVVWIPRLEDTLNTWTYTDANGWEQTSRYQVQDLPRYRDTEGFSSDKFLLFYSAGWGERSRLRTYSHDYGRNWVEHDRFEFDQSGSQLEDTGHGIQSRNIAFDGEHILFGYKRENVVQGLTVSADGKISQQLEGSCDYTTADQYDGYGWNPVTQESCPPLEGTETQRPVIDQPLACIDSDGDGFGWNGVETCVPGGGELLPVANPPLACIDRDGDGYGWNGVDTCVPDEGEATLPVEQSFACIDTDGDGFGWNGIDTCVPDGGQPPPVVDQSLVCIDSDGDGYGWTGTQSCRVDAQGNIIIL